MLTFQRSVNSWSSVCIAEFQFARLDKRADMIRVQNGKPNRHS